MAMRMALARALLLALVASTAIVIDCKFDPSGISITGFRFEGCFQSTGAGGLRTILDHHGSDLLVGALYVGEGTQQQVYVLDGRAVSDVKATVSGVLAGGSGATVNISLALVIANQQSDDKLTVTIGSQPPSAQLSRCLNIL